MLNSSSDEVCVDVDKFGDLCFFNHLQSFVKCAHICICRLGSLLSASPAKFYKMYLHFAISMTRCVLV